MMRVTSEKGSEMPVAENAAAKPHTGRSDAMAVSARLGERLAFAHSSFGFHH